MVEAVATLKRGEERWELVDWLVEVESKGEVSKSGREMIDRFVEVLTKGELGEGLWEVVDWVVELS